MSGNGSDKEMKFWEFIKECMQARLEQIGTEGLKEREYRELNEKLAALVLLLKGTLKEEKWELINEYNESMAQEESDGEEAFYWQGFVDATRMLWEKEGKVDFRVEG
jgi:hypothetical protein